MKKRFAVVFRVGVHESLSVLIFPNRNRAKGYADGWMEPREAAGITECSAEVVEIKAVTKTKEER